MAKIVLDNIVSGYDLSKINVNFQRIAEQINNNILFRGVGSGEVNSLLQPLDANGQSIYNLPDPVLDGEPVPYGWLLQQPDNSASSAVSAAQSAAEALASSVAAQAAQLAAENAASIIVDWEYRGNWVTGFAYKKNNIVNGSGSYTGWSLIALEDHISSGVNTDADYVAGKWGILSQRGSSGPGSGDMLAANNLSDLTDTMVALTNLGGTSLGIDLFTVASPSAARTAISAQEADPDTAKTDVLQTFTAPQAGDVADTSNAILDIGAKQNFNLTPIIPATIDFSNLIEGLNGNIILDNTANVAISLAAKVKANSNFLGIVNTAGIFWVSYYCDGMDVYLSTSGAVQ